MIADKLRDVMDRHEGSVSGHQLRIRCPLCGHKGCDIAAGDSGRLIANCFSPECKGKGAAILAKLGLPTTEVDPDELAEIGLVTTSPVPCASEKKRNEAYRAILRACVLRDEDKQRLVDRGFTSTWIVRAGYRSWEMSQWGDKLREVLKPEWIDVPGVFTHPGDGLPDLCFRDPKFAGILVPCRTVKGDVIALKVRLHDAADGKMRVFSSAPWGGPVGPYVPHVPTGTKPPDDGRVMLTEGELKADYVASQGGMPVVSIPGVHGVPPTLETMTLHALGAKSVLLAMDQDKAGWQGTLSLIDRLGDSYGIGYADWKGAKGIDDAIRQQSEYNVLTGEHILSTLENKSRNEKKDTVQHKAHPGVPNGRKIPVHTAADILSAEFPPVNWILPDVIPYGVTLLAGKPKAGKSFLGIDLAVSVAMGRPILAEHRVPTAGPVLYVALEDVGRNVQRRLRDLLPVGGPIPDNLDICYSECDVPRMPEGLEWLTGRLTHKQYRLVIIDTLERFREKESGGNRSYSSDTETLEEITRVIHKAGVSLVLVHHVRKNLREGADVFDGVLGSTGLTASVDTVAVLTRDRSDKIGKLDVVGREVAAVDLLLSFDNGRWVELPADSEVSGRQDPLSWLLAYLELGDPVQFQDMTKAAASVGLTKDQLIFASGKVPNLEKVSRGRAGSTWRLLLTSEQKVSRLEARIADLTSRAAGLREDGALTEAAQLTAEIADLEGKLSNLKGVS